MRTKNICNTAPLLKLYFTNFAAMKSVLSAVLSCLCLITPLFAQEEFVPIGQWKAYLPYTGSISVADAGEKVYVANGQAVFSYNKSDNTFDRLSKANGLSDVDATGVFYGAEQKTLVIPYLNSNVDVIVNGVVQNFPYIKSASISGNKSVNHAYFFGDSIYLSTGFGLVVYDYKKQESPATYFFIDEASGSYFNVNSTIVFGNAIYAATDKGVYRASLENPLLENFNNWESLSGELGLGEGSAQYFAAFNNRLYVIVDSASVYEYDGISWLLYYYDADWLLQHISSSPTRLIITQIDSETTPPDARRIMTVDINDSYAFFGNDYDLQYPFATVMDSNKDYWIADLYSGLLRYSNEVFTHYLPNGPGSSKVFDMEYYDNILWVAPGEVNNSWNYQYNRDGFFEMNYGNWTNINNFVFPALDTVLDFITMTIDARTGKSYFGSYGGGLAEFDNTNFTLQIFDETNTGENGLKDIGVSDPGSCRIGGLQFDINGNLWISNFGVETPLVVRKADGTWKNFQCYLPSGSGNQTAQIVIDDFDQKWVQIPRGTGILVYNHGSGIDDVSDDETRVLSTGAGNGNLPVGYVNCLVKDLDGEIWVGTNEGVAVFYNPGAVMDGGTAADAAQPLVNLGGYYDYLLGREIVNTIAVDGANRKWIGTNSGVFLVSADGTEQILSFTEDNSPLLSNIILNITINGENGEVYFGTSKGICSYRSTATSGTAEHTDVKVFPNPVREDYSGLIAISGLANNAQVKITDASGRMIFETVALGGQAVWDGKGYEGNRAATGVYVVYSSNDDGSDTYVTKILIVN